MKKFIAILCTITLLVGTVSVSGATASDGDKDGDVVQNPWADLFTTTAAEVTTENVTTAVVETTTQGTSGDDYSSLTYTTISCDGGADLEYCVVSQDIEGWGTPWYGDAGNTFQMVYAGGTVNPAESTTVKVNGVETAQGTGIVSAIGAGLIKVNPTQMTDNAYTAVEITTATGSALVVFKKGTPGTAPVETTTEEVTTTAKPVETTVLTEETTTEKTPSGYNPGFDPSSLTYTTIACDGQSNLTLDYNIYESTVAGLVPWYGDGGNTFMIQFSGDAGVVSGVTINGETPADGVITKTATGLVKINPTTFADNSYTIIEVTTENGNFTVVVKKGTPAEVPTVTTQVVETTVLTEETTTEDITNGAPEMMEMTDCIKDNEWHQNGGYSYYVGSTWGNSSAQMAVDPEDEDHVQIKQLTSDWSQAWTLQLKKIVSNVTPGETYTLEVDVYASKADGTIRVSGDVDYTLVEGTQKITIQATANDEGVVEFVAGLGWVGLDNVLDFSNPVVYDANGNVVYPSDEVPTTEAPTTEAPTTEAPTVDNPTTNVEETTTAKPVETTTAAPTTQKPTTVAPTTTQKATVVKVAKSKVKKATKKKSAKKIKLSLKKVKGAKYQIQISKAKKFKKKNILVKKKVKKVKVTIKSKKIKNKKKLYVRVRAYKVVNGKTYYSKWSKAKKAKIKK